MGIVIRTSGDFESLAAELQAASRQRLEAFAERYTDRFSDIELHAHLKRHDEHERAAAECGLNFYTDKGHFHAAEQAYGCELALHQALEALQTQLEKYVEHTKL